MAGNARSEWMAEGACDAIAEQCFGTFAVDRYLLEFDDQRSGSFEPLRFLPKDKHVVLGLITTKTPKLEDKDAVRHRVDEATPFVALDRLAVSPQRGFASVVEGNKITPADQRAKLALVIDFAREIRERPEYDLTLHLAEPATPRRVETLACCRCLRNKERTNESSGMTAPCSCLSRAHRLLNVPWRTFRRPALASRLRFPRSCRIISS